MTSSNPSKAEAGKSPDHPGYCMPLLMTTPNGVPRRVGVEIEMSGIELQKIADLLVANYGGTIDPISEYELRVKETSMGDFKVDLDFEYLQKIGRKEFDTSSEWSREFEQFAADAIQALMKNLIPCELITPPLPFGRLQEMDSVIGDLRRNGANGSRQALFATFGVHLNPELPDLELPTILSYLQAFICLQAWLEDRDETVLSRKLSPFIRSYPGDYEELVLREEYSPSLAQLIDDYLQHNPSRNRMLDMLPMFAHLDETRVLRAVPGEKIRKRPTLHYRLPNCDIDNPAWGLWSSWNDWQQVEILAGDRTRLKAVCEALRQSRNTLDFSLNDHAWKTEVKQWLSDLS